MFEDQSPLTLAFVGVAVFTGAFLLFCAFLESTLLTVS